MYVTLKNSGINTMNTPKCNCINKVAWPLKGKCQYECIMYDVQVYSCRPNNSSNNLSCIDKTVYVGFTQGLFKKRYYHCRSSFAQGIYRHRTSLSNDVWKLKRSKVYILY